MATPGNIGIQEAKCKLSLDRSATELKSLKERNFSFTITDDGNGQSCAQFEVKDDDGIVLRSNISKPFRKGAIELKTTAFQKPTKLTRDAFVVKVKKHGSISLKDLF